MNFVENAFVKVAVKMALSVIDDNLWKNDLLTLKFLVSFFHCSIKKAQVIVVSVIGVASINKMDC